MCAHCAVFIARVVYIRVDGVCWMCDGLIIAPITVALLSRVYVTPMCARMYVRSCTLCVRLRACTTIWVRVWVCLYGGRTFVCMCIK